MILRSYGCEECGYFIEVELRADQWDQGPPECPRCSDTVMGQEFKPPSIGGSAMARAAKMAETIAAEDYNVADFQAGKREGDVAKVRYRDQSAPAASWGAPADALAQALAVGRETRLQHGSGLDIIKTMPDLIAASKRRSAKIW